MERWPAPAMLVSRQPAPPQPREAAAWYYRANDQERGPVPESQIRALVEAGMLRASDFVWREGLPEWVEVRTVPGLMPRSMVKPPSAPGTAPPLMPVAQVVPSDSQQGLARADDAESREPETKECPFCASQIPIRAKVCRDCGETVDVALRAAEEAKREAKAARRDRDRERDRDRGPRDRVVIHRDRRDFPHVLHLILTIFTAGLWLPIWIIHYVIWESS